MALNQQESFVGVNSVRASCVCVSMSVFFFFRFGPRAEHIFQSILKDLLHRSILSASLVSVNRYRTFRQRFIAPRKFSYLVLGSLARVIYRFNGRNP